MKLQPKHFPYLPPRWVTELAASIPDITYAEACKILLPKWERRKYLLSQRALSGEEARELRTLV